jgi:hypothetical protein
MNQEIAVARRARFKKEGCADVLFELHCNKTPFDFTTIENGKVGLFWQSISPQQAIWGRGLKPLSLDEAWDRCVAKRFAGYTVAEFEEGFAD